MLPYRPLFEAQANKIAPKIPLEKKVSTFKGEIVQSLLILILTQHN